MGLSMSSWEDNNEWRKNSKCWNECKDPNFFFVEGSEAVKGRFGVSVETIENERKHYCDDCESINDCLSWALNTNEEFGILGGSSASDRKRIKRRTQARRRQENQYTKPKKQEEFIGPAEPYSPKSNRQKQAG